jgi:hypothetical protein
MGNAARPLGLTDEEALALVTLLNEAIEADRYSRSPRVRLLRGNRSKLPMAPTRSSASEAADPGGARSEATAKAVLFRAVVAIAD